MDKPHRVQEKRKKGLSLLLLLLLGIEWSGCATIVSGKTQDIMISSNPPGVQVRIDDGVMEGQTPMMVPLARKKRHTVELAHGGQKVVRATTRGFNWWYLGNLILGGVIGLVVDPITGAIFEVKPDAVHVDFNSTEEQSS